MCSLLVRVRLLNWWVGHQKGLSYYYKLAGECLIRSYPARFLLNPYDKLVFRVIT